MLKICFVDRRSDVIEAFTTAFEQIPTVTTELISGDFTTIQADFSCIITSGNSYGIMDGGFDDAVRRYFGRLSNNRYKIENTIQNIIKTEYMGMLPVGSSFVTSLDTNPIHVCYTPTMEIPKRVYPRNAYAAFRAALTAIYQHNKNIIDGKPTLCKKCDGLIEYAISSAFCTSTGGVKPEASATMMALAYVHAYNEISQQWPYVFAREREIDTLAKL